MLSPDGQLKFTTGRTESCWQTAERLKLEAVTEGLSFALFSPPLLLYFSLLLFLKLLDLFGGKCKPGLCHKCEMRGVVYNSAAIYSPGLSGPLLYSRHQRFYPQQI